MQYNTRRPGSHSPTDVVVLSICLLTRFVALPAHPLRVGDLDGAVDPDYKVDAACRVGDRRGVAVDKHTP